MNDLKEMFFFFLRRGLCGKPYTDKTVIVLARRDWEELFGMACAQAVSGLFVDGVACTSWRPERDLWEQWLAHVLYLEHINERIARRGNEWVGLLAEEGIKAYVFKGASAATWYPHPLHRSFGDIDMVVDEGWEKLKRLLGRRGIPFRNERGDLAVDEEGLTTIEFHRCCESLYNPVTNARFRALQRSGQGNELYLVCLIVHLRRHFLTYGIGLKQVCDVVMMLRHAPLDQRKLARMLRRLRLEKFCGVLFGFIDTYLGGSKEYPFLPDFDDKDFYLMRQVIIGDGYLLKHRQENAGRQNRFSLVRIAGHAWFWAKRCLKLGRMMPDEACWFLLHQAVWRIGNKA